MNQYEYTINMLNPDETNHNHSSPTKASLNVCSGINTKVAGDPLIWIEFKSKGNVEEEGKLLMTALVEFKELVNSCGNDESLISPLTKTKSRSSNSDLETFSSNSRKNLELPKVVRAVSGNWTGHINESEKTNKLHELKISQRKVYESQKDVIDRIFKTDEFNRVSYDMLLDNYKEHRKPKKPNNIQKSSTDILQKSIPYN